MKCEIITIIDNNYGNRLQNYALQEVLKKYGFDVKTNCVVNNKHIAYFKQIIKSLRLKTTSDIFALFNKKNIKFRYTETGQSIDDSSIDYFIAGSDQIWNPLFKSNSDREFLTFTEAKKKVSYAASIGVSKLEENELKRFKINLADFEHISVREEDAANIIASLNVKKPDVVLDPTMLLVCEEWKRIVNQSKINISHPFIVKYFLGIRDCRVEEKIDEFAKENNCEIIDINNARCPYLIGPAEFLYLISKSLLNFVDSFHGTVFSLLFNKPFYTFQRPNEEGYGNMNSRFETLFSLFEVKGRYILDFTDLNFSTKIDYNDTNKILQKERIKSINFLKNALGITRRKDMTN